MPELTKESLQASVVTVTLACITWTLKQHVSAMYGIRWHFRALFLEFQVKTFHEIGHVYRMGSNAISRNTMFWCLLEEELVCERLFMSSFLFLLGGVCKVILGVWLWCHGLKFWGCSRISWQGFLEMSWTWTAWVLGAWGCWVAWHTIQGMSCKTLH